MKFKKYFLSALACASLGTTFVSNALTIHNNDRTTYYAYKTSGMVGDDGGHPYAALGTDFFKIKAKSIVPYAKATTTKIPTSGNEILTVTKQKPPKDDQSVMNVSAARLDVMGKNYLLDDTIDQIKIEKGVLTFLDKDGNEMTFGKSKQPLLAQEGLKQHLKKIKKNQESILNSMK